MLQEDDGDWVKMHVVRGGGCERERKAEDNMESGGGEGHKRAWIEEGGCIGV